MNPPTHDTVQRKSDVLPEGWNPINRAYLSGLAYYDYPIAFRAIRRGDTLTLKREKTNKYDPRAVAVYFCGRKLGYWPFPKNTEIALIIDQGGRVKARVVEITADPNEIYQALLAEAFVEVVL
jgi:hypothetical protein